MTYSKLLLVYVVGSLVKHYVRMCVGGVFVCVSANKSKAIEPK